MAKSKPRKRIYRRIKLTSQEALDRLHDSILTKPVSNYATPQPLIEMVEELVAANRVTHVDRQSEETLIECRICGEWEGCKDDCPGPWLDVWLNGVDALPGNLSHVARLRGSQLALPGMKKR